MLPNIADSTTVLHNTSEPNVLIASRAAARGK
jgi:hypothetical protein